MKVPEEAEVVRRIFDETLAGRKLREIVAGLNADGILTQQGRPWPRVTIQRILRSHVYAGWSRSRARSIRASTRRS